MSSIPTLAWWDLLARLGAAAGLGAAIGIEREPFSRDELDELLDLAAGGIETIRAAQDDAIARDRP